MYRSVDLLMLSMWILVVFALPAYNSKQLDLSVNQNSAIGDGEDIEFRKHKRYRWKSIEKCEEYAEAVVQVVWVMPLSGSRPVPISIGCKNLINSLISGSEIAEPGEFPHMAAIGWLLQDRTIGYYCGGSLISDRWIVTAAHCTHGPMGKPVVVRLGCSQLSDDKSGQLIRIESTLRHPAYSPPSMYADLALLRLAKTVTFEANIKPACLYMEFDKTPAHAWVTGWGKTEFDEPSDVLIKAKLEVIDNVRCSLSYNSTTSVPNGVVPSMLCAGDPKGGWKKDTCQGDSGGPLQSIHPNGCLYELVGVTSFGQLCGTSNLPGVYTRVSHYVEWIESIVWLEED